MVGEPEHSDWTQVSLFSRAANASFVRQHAMKSHRILSVQLDTNPHDSIDNIVI